MPKQSEKKSATTKKVRTVDNPLLADTSGVGRDKGKITETSAQASATVETKPGKKAPPRATDLRALERQNKELLVRIKELELGRTKDDREDAEPAAVIEGVSEESRGVLRIVKDLEAQVDNAFLLNDALEADLADVQAKLVEETGVRSELQARMQLLEAKASLLEQLQDELSFVEEERAEIARKLKESELQFDQITTERNALAEQMIAADASIGNLEQAKIDLEAQVLNLEEKVVDLGKVRKELAQVKGARDELTQQVKDLTGRLDASETSRKALEQDLSTSQDMVSGLQGELKERQKKLDATQARLADVNDRLGKQEAKNHDLVEANKRLEREVKALIAKNEIIGAELEATKRVLHEIHGAASRTTKRLRDQYYKSAD